MNTRLGFHRDIIKYFAMFTMLLNHISYIFMEAGTFWAELFTDIGYFTAITMCYFLVEGFEYTHSRKQYGKRFLVFAVVSQLPYCLARTKGKILNITEMNMIFTLLLCFFILCVLKYVKTQRMEIFVDFSPCYGIDYFRLGAFGTCFYTPFCMGKGKRKKDEDCIYSRHLFIRHF